MPSTLQRILPAPFRAKASPIEHIGHESGRISHLLMATPMRMLNDSFQSKVIRNLFNYIAEREIEMELVCKLEELGKVKHWIDTHTELKKYNLLPVPKTNSSTIWMRDRFEILGNPNNPGLKYLCPPDNSWGTPNIRYSHFSICNHAGFLMDPAPLQFAGGNIIVGASYILIGKDALQKNQALLLALGYPEDGIDDHIKTYFRDYWGQDKSIFFVGTEDPISLLTDHNESYSRTQSFQPIFHLDMFISPAGASNIQGKIGKLLVGEPLAIGQAQIPPNAQPKVFEEMIEHSLGDFEIVRNPLPIVKLEKSSRQNEFEGPLFEYEESVEPWIASDHFWATYNNTLIEVSRSEFKVWLPLYGKNANDSEEHLPETTPVNPSVLDQIDASMIAQWKSLGFKVVTFGNFNPFAISYGALRCLTKEIHRVKEE